MSRIGKHAVPVPPGVNIEITGQLVKANGPLGKLSLTVVDDLLATFESGKVTIAKRNEGKRAKNMWGTTRTLVNNLVVGVSQGFTKSLEINGVGYRAAVAGNVLTLQLGFSHDVVYQIPDGIKIAAPKPTELTISGADRQLVGKVASEIRDYRGPEPYKGKGVKYSDEILVRKEGKKK